MRKRRGKGVFEAMNIYTSISQLIGNTPLVELTALRERRGLAGRVAVKLEYLNPAGSTKDRAAKQMLDDAEAAGLIGEGSVIIEPTSGNTGIGLAAIAANRGYRVILTMPDSMSAERIRLLKAYGAELVLTPGAEGMAGAVAKAEEIAASTPGSYIPGQFVNPSNARAHELTTGPEIWRDTDGTVDIFVAGIGTGGTISGTGHYLRSVKPDVRIVGFEPDTSPLITQGRAGAHKLQGIGANFIPDLFDRDICDEIMTISAEDAYAAARELGSTEGFLVGITSGAALSAAIQLAQRPENKDKLIVALLPDTGDRYLSTDLFD